MRTITFRDKQLQIPESVDELSSEMYAVWLSLVLLRQKGVITLAEMRTYWLSRLLGLPLPYRQYVSSISSEAESHVACLEPFFSGHEPVVASCRNLLPRYKGWTSVAGDMLDGLRFGPFIDSLAAIKLITLAQHDGDEAEVSRHMRAVALALYTPPSPDAQPPSLLVSHAVLFFSTVWQHITEQPVCVNGEEIPFTILFSGASSAADDHTGWQGIAFEVASQGVFGPMPSLREAPFWDVLLYLYKCRFETLHSHP